MLRKLLAAVAVCVLVGPVAAQPDREKLTTVVYDLQRLIGTTTDGSAPPHFADADAIVKVILDALPAFRVLKPDTHTPQLVLRDGRKLEVCATADNHHEISNLIEALSRINDLKVDVRAVVYELDAATFDKLAKALPKTGRGRPGAAILFATGEENEKEGVAKETEKALAEVNTILKAARQVQKSEGRFPHGVESTFSARHSVVTFRPHAGMPAVPPPFVKEGFRLSGVPVPSADQRFLRLSLTEKSAILTGFRKRELGEEMGAKILVQSPELEDAGASSSAVVADGGTAIFRLAYAPKDKVWVVVLTPTIFIQAEEDERNKEKKK